MSTYRLPADLQAYFEPAVAAHIEKYEPNLLATTEWWSLQGPVCELAARTFPVSGPDAQAEADAVDEPWLRDGAEPDELDSAA